MFLKIYSSFSNSLQRLTAWFHFSPACEEITTSGTTVVRSACHSIDSEGVVHWSHERSEQALDSLLPDVGLLPPFRPACDCHGSLALVYLVCPVCGERPACLPSVVHRPCSFLFPQVLPCSALRLDLFLPCPTDSTYDNSGTDGC